MRLGGTGAIIDAMKLQVISVAILLASAAPAFASPSDIADQATGILGSPVMALPGQDPAICEAVRWLQAQKRRGEVHVSTPSVGMGTHHDPNHFFILGGAETLPL